MNSICLALREVSKSFGIGPARRRVLHNLNLEVRRGEFVAIVGYSGSGKTTLISLLAGLIAPGSGEVYCNGKPINGPGPDRGVVFQNYSLLPWLSALDNVLLAVDQIAPQWSQAERRAHAERHLALVNLSHARDRKPAQLSGGMRQRVALARALAMNPDVLLLDEPLSALDALTRAGLQAELERIWSSDQKTAVLITNHVDEALLLADRIVPLTPGPDATLGQGFSVPLPRPRRHEALKNDREFIELRATVTAFLVASRNATLSLQSGESSPAPHHEPVSLPPRRAASRNGALTHV